MGLAAVGEGHYIMHSELQVAAEMVRDENWVKRTHIGLLRRPLLGQQQAHFDALQASTRLADWGDWADWGVHNLGSVA